MQVRVIFSEKQKLVEVSFLIRVKNEGVNLKRCIDSIHALRLGLPYEIIILDSGSMDGSLDCVSRQHLSIYSIEPKDFRFGSSCNCIAGYAAGSVCVFLSGHVYFTDAESFVECVKLIKRHPMSAGYFRQIPNRFVGANKYEEAFLSYHYPDSKSNFVSRSLPRGFSNAGSIINRDAILDNPFPDVIASEDILWAKEHILKGRKIFYFPKCNLAHSHNESVDQLRKRVSINLKAQYGDKTMLFRSIYVFIGVFFNMVRIDAPLKECVKYSFAHSVAYIIR